MTNSKTARDGEFASDKEKAETTGGEQASVLKGERAKWRGTPVYTEAELRRLRIRVKPGSDKDR